MTEGQRQLSVFLRKLGGDTYLLPCARLLCQMDRVWLCWPVTSAPGLSRKGLPSLCVVTYGSQMIRVHGPFGPVTVMNYTTWQDARASGSSCPKSKFADGSSEAATGPVTYAESSVGVLSGACGAGIQASPSCSRHPGAFPLSKTARTEQRTRFVLAGCRLDHFI